MTPEAQKVRESIEILSNLSDSVWEVIATIIEKECPKPKDCPITQEEYENKIIETLHYLGVTANLKGYYYIQTAILIFIKDKHPENISMTKECYLDVAKKFQTTPSRVERAIRHLIEKIWLKGDWETIEEIFRNTVDSQKARPTNQEAIMLLAEYVKRHM